MKKNIGGISNDEKQFKKYSESIERIYKNSIILGNSGNNYLKIKLDLGDIIITQLSSLICMNSGVEKAEIQFDGILHGFSKILAGEPLYYQTYTGKGNGFIYIGSNFINSIIVIKIKRGEKYRLSRNSFLASTLNIKISFTFQMKGILGIGQEEGFFLPIAECIGLEHGYIWLCAFGHLEKIIIPQNDYLIIDNGIFLACNDKYQYEISKLGKSLFSSFFGGEGFGMKFIGPAEIFIQTKNINDFLVQEQPTTTLDNQTTNNIINNGDFVGELFNFVE
jgi:uncharacterized protein (AIM24 family)